MHFPRLTVGETLEAEADFSSTTKVFLYWTAINQTIELPYSSSSATWQFITAASVDQQDAEDAYEAARFNPNLLSSHTAAWEDIWARGSIQVLFLPECKQANFGSHQRHLV